MKTIQKNTTSLAPIALFVYNRPSHTKRTIEALINNNLSLSSTLYIFSDAAKSDTDIDKVNEVRCYIKKITGFKNIHIRLQQKNLGLAQSIISGVTEIVEEHGNVIVLEDDLETSPYFLTFMNDALELYKDSHEVMHISGSIYPTKFCSNESTFFLSIPLCWGWATWKDAWSDFSNDINVMERFNYQQQALFDFNSSYTYWKQLELNYMGEIDTWFIFWYATLFLQGGLSLFPSKSLVQNIGMDGTGIHCGTTNIYHVEVNFEPVTIERIPILHSKEAFDFHVQYFQNIKLNFFKKLSSKIYSLLKRG